MNMKFLASLITVFISAILIISFAPMFIQATYETQDMVNDNSGWARLKYVTNFTTDIDVKIEGDTVTLGGTVPQSGPVEDMIIWADSNLSVYIKDGTPYYIGNDSGTVTISALSDSFHIIKSANNVRITDGGDTYTFPNSIWAYIPNATGGYANFMDGTDSHLNEDNYTRPFVGGLLGIYTYNNYNSGGYDLSFTIDKDGEVISGADWIPNYSE